MSVLVPAWPEVPQLSLDPVEESLRLEELHALRLLDSPPEYRFDRITRLASEFFRVPTAYVAFIDDHRQWLKSRVGLCHAETTREQSFCQYTIHRSEPLVIPDTLLHPIGRSHPLVVGAPHVRFYAGVPLSGPSGRKIGTFCLADTTPRTFTEGDVASLVAFGALVEREINLGEIIQAQTELLETREKLVSAKRALDHELTDAAKYVRMMLPPPINGEEIIDWHFHPSTRLGGDGLGYRRVSDDQIALYILDVTGHGLGSALLAVTALELLRNSAVQVDLTQPRAVVDRLNRTFQMKDHAGKFFSVWYGVYSRSQQTITYANAGHPRPLLFTRENGRPRLTKTAPGNSVLGIMPALEIPEITIPFPPTSELYLFTDGLYEILDGEEGRGSYDEFFDTLEEKIRKGAAPWPTILRWHTEAVEKKIIDDDVSILRFATRG
ncbi:MAG: GAF domain-containing SpoIIE family protein phosphatase [Verrucomicrobiota bacterium]